MIKGLCENCLNVLEAGADRLAGCPCGHVTRSNDSTSLYDLAKRVGEKKIEAALFEKMDDLLRNVWRIRVGPRSVEISSNKLLKSIKIGNFEFADLFDIERIGIDSVRELIAAKKKEMEEVYLLRPMSSDGAAQIVAYLYDWVGERYDETIVQKVSDSGIQNFYLGKDVLNPSVSNFVYFDPDAELVLKVFGDAKLEKEYSSGRYLMSVSGASYPLAIVYKSKYLVSSKLFIFI